MISPLKLPLNHAGEYPLKMRQLRERHILLFRLLNRHFLLLTRGQIQRILALPDNSTRKVIVWMLTKRYLQRRYRADTFKNFQTPLYYLGPVGWRLAGNIGGSYKRYRNEVEERAERKMDHLLAVYDVLLKFVLESEVTRIIGGEDRFWQESFAFGNIPDAWIQYNGGAAFIEVDRGTETVDIVAKKIENYTRYKRSGAYDMTFRGCSFKVLFITTSEERIKALEKLTPSDDIWFAAMDEFMREELGHQHWFASHGFYALPVAPKEEMQNLP